MVFYFWAIFNFFCFFQLQNTLHKVPVIVTNFLKLCSDLHWDTLDPDPGKYEYGSTALAEKDNNFVLQIFRASWLNESLFFLFLL